VTPHPSLCSCGATVSQGQGGRMPECRLLQLLQRSGYCVKCKCCAVVWARDLE
jgi:hypothetical protein